MTLISFPARLDALADRRPDAPAVTCASSSITRSELRSASRRMARELQQCGVDHGDFVTVAMPNSIEWFIAYIACWNIGAIPQPVSAKLPARELAAIVELAGSHVVVGAPDDAMEMLPDTIHHLANRAPVRRRVLRCAAPGRDVTGMEGTHLRGLDGTAEADRLGRPRRVRHRGATTVSPRTGRLPRDARAAVPQRPGGLGLPGVARRESRRAAPEIRRRSRRSPPSRPTEPT